MKKIAKEDIKIERLEMSREDAIKHFEALGEIYKVEIIKDIAQGEMLSFYKQGDFMDLCRGPHVPSTSYIKAFKLKISLLELIGEETLIIKCFKEFTDLLSLMIKD